MQILTCQQTPKPFPFFDAFFFFLKRQLIILSQDGVQWLDQ